MGGVCTWVSSASRVRSAAAAHDRSTRLANRMCSRPDNGSESTPMSPSSPLTVPFTSSARASASAALVGARNELMRLRGRPAVEPGVHTTTSAAWRSLVMSVPSIPHPASPSFHCWAATEGSPDSTQGANSSALRLGNVRARLARSPLGSMRMQGTPASIASSIMANAKPVFPDPVWPTMTAWVVSAAGASVTGVAVRAWVVASTLSPRCSGAGRALMTESLSRQQSGVWLHQGFGCIHSMRRRRHSTEHLSA